MAKETINWVPQLKDKPDPALVGWAMEHSLGKLGSELLIFSGRSNGRDATVRCSHCGASFIVPTTKTTTTYCWGGGVHVDRRVELAGDLAEENDVAMCPACGVEATIRHISKIPNYGEQKCAYVLEIGRVGRHLVLYGWRIDRMIYKDGYSVVRGVPYEAYVVEDKKLVRLTNPDQNLVGWGGYWAQRVKMDDRWYEAEYVYPWDPDILIGSTAEKSGLAKYLKQKGPVAKPVRYLRTWKRHPRVENLVVQGAAGLLDEILESGYQNEVNWREKRPCRMLGLNKNEFRQCINNGWNVNQTMIYAKIREMEPVTPKEVFRVIRGNSLSRVKDLVDADRGGLSVMRCLRYLERQNEMIGYLLDYWRMADEIGWNLEDVHVRLPKDLEMEHDRAAQEHRDHTWEKSSAKWDKQFQKRAETLARYEWEADGLCIRPAKSGIELYQEGAVLRHCVANYMGDMAQGKTAIFFIRHTSDRDRSYFTLELDEQTLTVRQNRGKCNRARTDEVRAFEEKWLEHLKKLRKAGKLPIKKTKKAKEVNVA